MDMKTQIWKAVFLSANSKVILIYKISGGEKEEVSKLGVESLIVEFSRYKAD